MALHRTSESGIACSPSRAGGKAFAYDSGGTYVPAEDFNLLRRRRKRGLYWRGLEYVRDFEEWWASEATRRVNSSACDHTATTRLGSS